MASEGPSNQEALSILKADVNKFNELRRQDPRRRFDFTGADLSGANLTNANIGGCVWAKASFKGANLTDAVCTGADLRGANFHGANLHNANLHHANLRGADFRGAKVHKFDGAIPGRLCVGLASFEGVSWDQDYLASVIEVLNTNSQWKITYKIEPKK